MPLSLYNTLTHLRELFKPIDSNLVKMYVCGPTVYDHPHIGNARSVVVYDILYRILIHIFGNSHIRYVRNITDVDDKIINRARKLDIQISELTTTTTKDFQQSMDYLNCLAPTIQPKATKHIKDMIDIIQKLLDLGHAYIAQNHIYFDVSSAKNYTALSGRTFSEMQHLTEDQGNTGKRHPNDFVLWKPALTSATLGADFASPFGVGRPGWHIECSAMSYKYLGENFDIHGGGADLIFPHHTNEIAQSTCAFPTSSFARTWVHNGFLTVNGEKMSKSLGNFLTVQDLQDRNTPGDALRLLLISTHYRKPLDFSKKALADASKTIDYWYRAIAKVDFISDDKTTHLPHDFLNALYEDLNTPLAIKIINDYAKAIHAIATKQDKALYARNLLTAANFIGLMHSSLDEWFHGSINSEQINDLIARRHRAKEQKNWQLADKIRSELESRGIIIEDKQGKTWWRQK